MDLTARDIPGYRLLDTGAGRRLEEVCGVRLDRPCVAALWPPRLPASEWRCKHVCERTEGGGGRWIHQGPAPKDLRLRWPGLGAKPIELLLRLTDFGHLGLFPEQEPLWRATQERVLGTSGARVANLFAYTGAASLAAAAAGAQVFHVDSAQGILDWAKENRTASGIAEQQLKLIHEDVRAFCELSRKRGWTYNVVLADPPAWGHGKKKGEAWRLEEHVANLVNDLQDLVAPGGVLYLSAHAPGVQAAALANLLGTRSGQIVSGDLGLAHDGDARVLPSGCWASWQP